MKILILIFVFEIKESKLLFYSFTSCTTMSCDDSSQIYGIGTSVQKS